MDVLLQDIRYGFRQVIKHPGLAAISILALGLGLGLTATVWSINYGALLRGLPFEESNQLIYVGRTRPTHDINRMGVPIHDYTEWRAAQRSFVDLAAFYDGTVNVSGTEGRPERYEGAFMTPNTFRLLRANAMLGRTFTDEEGRIGGPPVVILGYELWKNRFEGDSTVVGKTMRANGVTAEIIGVMPRGFLFPQNSRVWVPLRLDANAIPWGQGQFLDAMGRLKPGVSQALALQDLAATSRRIAQEHPKENEGVAPLMMPFTESAIGEEPTRMLWTMMGAVFGVLLIACSNVANLLLARAASRTKEVAIRTALGARRRRIVAQLLTESLVLAGVGALLGIAIAWVGVRLFNNAIAATEPPFWIVIRVDGPVLAFVAATTVVSALIAGVVPALQATRLNVHDVLKDESRGSSGMHLGKFSKGLVVAELALSCGLLVGAGFMIQSVAKLRNFDYGIETRNVFTTRIGLFEATYPDSASRQRFWTDLVQRLEAMPGQRGAALTTRLPGLGSGTQNFALEGKSYATDRDYPSARFVAVTPSYFPTFRLRAVEGRVFAAGDIGGTLPVAVVTRNFARKHFPDGSGVGRRIRFGQSTSQEPWRTIVGVIPDVWYQGTDTETPEVILTPIAQGDYRFLSVAMAAGGNPMALAEPVRAQVVALDPDQPTYFTRTLQQAIDQNAWFYGVFGTLFMVFGFAALFLATVGVYGVMSFAVSRRTQEVGVRMALGAGARDVLALFLRQGALQVGLGITIGLGLAVLLAQGLRIILFQVDTKSPFMFAAVSATLAATGLLAVFIPARRATRVDPMVALRYE